MSSCSSNCATVLPALPKTECRQPTKKGGISKVIFITCDAILPLDYCDEAAWLALIAACNVRGSGKLLGSKPAASFIKTRLDSCSPEKVTGGSQTIVFTDFTSTKSGSEYAFWDDIMAGAAGMLVIWLDCNGKIFGPASFSAEVSEVKDDNSTGNSRFEGVLTIDTHRIFEPASLPASVLAALDANQDKLCEIGDILDDNSVSCASINLRPSVVSRQYALSAAGGTTSVQINFTRVNCTTTPVTLAFNGGLAFTVALTATVLGSQTYDITIPITAAGQYPILVTGSAACGEVGSTSLFLVVS